MNPRQIEILSQKISKCTGETTFNQSRTKLILEYMTKQQPWYKDLGYQGNGEYSLILKAIFNGNQVALKIIEYSSNPGKVEQVRKEYEYLSSLKNCSYFAPVNQCFYLNDKNKHPKYFIVDMDLHGQNLKQLLENQKKNNKEFDDELKEIMAIQLLDALNTLHTKGIFHRNIKPTNILVALDHTIDEIPFVLKMSDLGTCSMPLKRQNEKQKKSSDLFSLGIILLEIDNFMIFESKMLNNWQLCNLQRQGIKALNKYSINKISSLYKLAQKLLEPDNQISTQAILLEFIQDKYYNAIVYSIITQQSVSTLFKLKFPCYANKKVEQIVTIQDSIKRELCKEENEFKKQQLQKIIDLTSNEILELKQINNKLISFDQIKSAIKVLYKKNKFSLFSYLGRGSASITFQVNNNACNRQSVIRLSLITDRVKMWREISVLQSCHSPYIAQFYGYELFEDKNKNQYVVFEFEKCKYSLMHYLDEHKEEINKNSDLKTSIALQIMDSVNTLHHHNVLHGDIKLENFLVSEDAQGKIIVKLTQLDQAAFLQNSDQILQKRESIYNNYDSQKQLELKNVQETSVNCLYSRGNSGTPIFRSLERAFTKDFPLSFLSDSYSTGLCILLLDNFSQLDSLFVKNYFYLLSPQKIPLMKFSHLFNMDSLIYKWSISLLAYIPSQRLLLREIIDSIQNPIIPLHSKLFPIAHLLKSNQKSSSLFLKNQEYPAIINLLSSDAFSCNLKSLYIYQRDTKENRENRNIILLSEKIQNLSQLSSLKLERPFQNMTTTKAISLAQGLINLSQLSSLVLDLSFNNIGNEQIIELSPRLSQISKLLSLTLNLSNNRITNEGVKELSLCLTKFKTLSNLVLCLLSNNLTDQSLISLLPLVSELNSLSSLALDISQNKISELSLCLSKQSQLVGLTLNTSSNQIGGGESTTLISSGLSKLNQLSWLKLDLTNNKIQKEDYFLLSLGLSQLCNLSSLTLDFSNNPISKEDVILLAEGVSKLRQLSSLSLNLSLTKFTSQGYSSLASGLSKLTQLTNLKLIFKFNSFTGQDLKILSSKLLILNQLFSFTLDLAFSNNIKFEEIISFIQNISKLRQLKILSLNLQENNIRSIKSKSFSSAIAMIQMSQLLCFTLNLSHNCNIKYEDYYQLLFQLSQFNQLESLSLNFAENYFKDEGVKSLSNGLQHLRNLSSLLLDLTDNDITTEGLSSLFSALFQLKQLANLDLNLSVNEFGSTGANQLESLSKMNWLSRLTLNLKDSGFSSAVMKSHLPQLFKHIQFLNLKF